MSNPLVSVIMTVYNGEKHVGEAVRSILGQTLTNFELVIVDDGSVDATLEVLQEFQFYPRVRILQCPRLGRARALNVAWKEARGKLIANLDADDIALPERLQRQSSYLEAHPEIALLGTAVIIQDEKLRTLRDGIRPTGCRELKRELIRTNPFVHSAVMIRRDVLEQVGGYDENLRILIDYDLWVRMAAQHGVFNLSEFLSVKRVHRDAYFQSRSHSWSKLRAHLLVRWRAWKLLSGSLSELRYVFLHPMARWVYARALRRKMQRVI